MLKVKISVIIPVYNTEIFLKRAIESVFKSSLHELEILVIDDASSGDCEEICNEYKNDSRIRYIRHQKNLGLFAARTTGITYATGEYLVHLDPDDWIINDIYTNAYNFAIKNSLDFVLFNVIQEDEDGKRWIEKENILKESCRCTGKDILNNIFQSKSKSWIWHVSWNKLMKTEKVRESMHHFHLTDHLNMYEDILWSVAIFSCHYMSNKIGILEQTGLVYYRHSQSITKSMGFSSYLKKYSDIQFVLKKINDILINYKIDMEYKDDFKRLACHLFEAHSPSKIKAFGSFNKLRLMIQIVKYTLSWSKHCKKNSEINYAVKILQRKVELLALDEIIIFGTGVLAVKLKKELKRKKVLISCFITSDKNIAKSKIHGTDIVTIEEGLAKGKCICIASIGSYNEISYMLKSHDAGRDITIITI